MRPLELNTNNLQTPPNKQSSISSPPKTLSSISIVSINLQVHAIVSLICTCTPNLANDFNHCSLGCLSCMVQVGNWSLTHDENPMHKDFPSHRFASCYCLGLTKACWAWFVYATFLWFPPSNYRSNTHNIILMIWLLLYMCCQSLKFQNLLCTAYLPFVSLLQTSANKLGRQHLS